METLQDLDLDRYYRIYMTVYEMTSDRGYIPLQKFLKRPAYISKYLGLLASIDSPEKFIDKMSLMFEKEVSQTLLVYFHILEPKLRKVDMEYVHQRMRDKQATQLVLIIQDKVTSGVTDILDVIGSDAQVFAISELTVNPNKHQLVPQHILLTADQKQEILDDYSINEMQAPVIYSTDPIVRWYNFQLGDMIKIIRAPNDITYRVVTVPLKEQTK